MNGEGVSLAIFYTAANANKAYVGLGEVQKKRLYRSCLLCENNDLVQRTIFAIKCGKYH